MDLNKTENTDNDQLITSKISWHNTNVRWLALLLACLFQFGSYFSTDYPSVLASEIKATFATDQEHVNQLYTYYSMPNVILPLLGGLFIDAIGIRIAMVGFYGFLIAGQFLCYISAVTGNFNVMLIGRLVFGLGGENCVVAQSYIVSKWFFGSELALALGLNITFARMGSVLGALLLGKVYIWFGDSLSASMFLCLIILLFAWVDTIGLAILDRQCDKRDKVEKKIEGDKISFKDVKEFKLDFYLLTLSCLACYSSYFLFQYNCVEMFKNSFHMTDSHANNIYSIPYYSAAVLTPVFGGLIDKFGQRTLFLIICGFLLIVVNIIFYSITCEEECIAWPIFGQIVNGFYYSLYAAVMWPCVPLCVPERTVGTAFGIVNAVQNIGLTIFPIIVGKIVVEETPQSYKNMMLFLGVAALIGLASNIGLYIVDRQNGGKMAKPSLQDEQTSGNQVSDEDQVYNKNSIQPD